MNDVSFRTHRLAGLEYGDLKERQKQVKRSMSVGYLILDMDAVEGEVVLVKDFEKLGGIALLDTLGDWIGLLQREYDKVHGEVYVK